jgi:Carboxypeptidase regulatory-like domain
MFRPRLVAIRRGQVLEVRNGDPTMHNLHSLTGADNGFNVSQVVGRPPFTVALQHAEQMLRITCDVHRWMNVYVAVVDHPYFAVTPSDGRFEIAGVPPGRHTVHVWHERYGPLSASVDVPAGGVAAVDLAYTGNEKAAPPPQG